MLGDDESLSVDDLIDASLPVEERILARLDYLYGEHCSAVLLKNIQRLIETHKQLRTRTVEGPFWTHDDVVLITYGDTIQSPAETPLATLRSFLHQHLADAFSMVHLLPFFPWSSDDGFSVTDFRAVNPALGNWKDIQLLSEDFDLAIDLVLNHCSRENLWFIDFIAGDEPACHYFHDVDPDTNLSLVVRPRSTPVLSGVRTQRGLRHVWTTFSNDQIDMNYSNPDVLLEFIDIMLYYFRRGARMIRLDAVAYLWKQVGTSCIHLPQTHQIVKLLRDILQLTEPGALIMTETNVPHAENITYFGRGDEAQVVYQFSLPPLLLHAIYSGQTQYLYDWAMSLQQMPLPQHCTFLNFTASHDGVGLRPLEGLVPLEEVNEMLQAMRERGGYISSKSNTDGTTSPYELNISYFDAFRGKDEKQQQWHIPAFLLSQIVSLSFKGIPAVYIHCLTATPNDVMGVERTGMTRAINRRKWDRSELEALIDNQGSETGHVFHVYKRLLDIRRQQTALHPDAEQQILELAEGLFGLQRIAPDGRQQIFALYNFTSETQDLAMAELAFNPLEYDELLQLSNFSISSDTLTLPPYGAFWFSNTGTAPADI
jgi:sucrose phosphorylase